MGSVVGKKWLKKRIMAESCRNVSLWKYRNIWEECICDIFTQFLMGRELRG